MVHSMFLFGQTAACTPDLFPALPDVEYIVDQPGPRRRAFRPRRPYVPIKQRPDTGAPAKREKFRRTTTPDCRWTPPAAPGRLGLYQQVFVSKIGGDQIIGASAPADVHTGSGGAYQITIGIERFQETRFIGRSIRLNSPQRAFVYEK
jgi:hypothetical protein